MAPVVGRTSELPSSQSCGDQQAPVRARYLGQAVAEREKVTAQIAYPVDEVLKPHGVGSPKKQRTVA